MPIFRRKPPEVEAAAWTGDLADMPAALAPFIASHTPGGDATINSFDGPVSLPVGDWLVLDPSFSGEPYVMPADAFAHTFEPAPGA